MGLSVLHFNASSINNKVFEINEFLSVSDIDVLSVNESWLTPNSRFKLLPVYLVFTCDRNIGIQGGGVLLAVKKELCPCQCLFKFQMVAKLLRSR